MSHIVYKATTPSNKVYIGITSSTLENRIAAHFSQTRRKLSNKRHTLFSNALKKYKNNIIFEILEDKCSFEEALFLEKYYIKYFDGTNRKLGYNISSGGKGRSAKHSEKTKEIIKQKNQQNPIFKKCAEKLKDFYIKNPNIRSINGKKGMTEQRKQESILLLSKYVIRIPIEIYNNEICLKFNSIKDATKFVKTTPSNLGEALKNNRVCKGYMCRRIN